MLSICIPHYNYQNLELFETLKSQAEQLHLNFELLIIDDASKEEHKSYLRKLTESPYRVEFLEKNIGRSAIRNLLAKKAKFERLLFLDGDSLVEHPDFIKNYWINRELDFISGGRYYQDKAPETNLLLHWLYGKKVESLANSQFHSCNFMIKKSVFEQIKFDENLRNYGYEDVLFGVRAKNMDVVLNNIENPIKHQQLKTNTLFLKDIEIAINNLKILEELKPKFKWADEIKLLKKYQQFKKIGFTILIPKINSKLFKKIENSLIYAPNKNFFLLNIYKLSLYHHIN